MTPEGRSPPVGPPGENTYVGVAGFILVINVHNVLHMVSRKCADSQGSEMVLLSSV